LSGPETDQSVDSTMCHPFETEVGHRSRTKHSTEHGYPNASHWSQAGIKCGPSKNGIQAFAIQEVEQLQ